MNTLMYIIRFCARKSVAHVQKGHAVNQGIWGCTHGSTNKSALCTQGKQQVLVPILVCVCHLHQDFLYVLVSGFHCTIHLRVIGNQIFVLDL